MTDITMCNNRLCPISADCERHTAKPSEHWQSMQFFNYTVGINGVICDGYKPNSKITLSITTKFNPPLEPR